MPNIQHRIARVERLCESCPNIIKVGDDVWTNPNHTFCNECGIKYRNGESVFRKKSLINLQSRLKDDRSCDECDSTDARAIDIDGKKVCKEHAGELNWG